MYKLAVIGNPIEHSLSPVVFGYFSKKYNINLVYEKILAENVNNFNSIVHNFFNSNGYALNVTSPYKSHAYNIATKCTSRAKFCKTGNLLYSDNGTLAADTTDGIGLVTDIEQNNNQSIFNKNILFIGNGFTIDSVLLDFIAKNPKSIAILARNQEKTHYLQNKFDVHVHQISNNYDIIINSSPNISDNKLFSKITTVSNNTLCYDMAYTSVKTYFHQSMQKINPQVIIQNGIGMLVEQAKVMFKNLFGISPNTIEIINYIRKSI